MALLGNSFREEKEEAAAGGSDLACKMQREMDVTTIVKGLRSQKFGLSLVKKSNVGNK
jgi:hypothetical protein